jgi:hypothetical protein
MINSTRSFKLYPNPGLSHHLHTPSRTTGYWLAGFVFGLTLLANMDAIGEMLEEVIPILLELAEKGSESFFEMFGLSPRLAQGVTAYVGFAVALILGYYLACKVQRLTHSNSHYGTSYKSTSSKLDISKVLCMFLVFLVKSTIFAANTEVNTEFTFLSY